MIKSLKMIEPSRDILIAMSLAGTIPFDAYWFVIMGSKSEYLANAKECEGRAQEMPPALRHTFITLAAHWRKLASNAAEVANRQESQEAADREKRTKVS
jgi:hypothetical protein